MLKIHIYKRPHKESPKRLRKQHRKMMISHAVEHREIQEAISQLSPIDSHRIHQRAIRDANRMCGGSSKPFYLHRLGLMVNLAYKYTLQLLETVAV